MESASKETLGFKKMFTKLLIIVLTVGVGAERIVVKPGQSHSAFNGIKCDGTLTADVEMISDNGKVSLLLVNEAVCSASPSKYIPSMSVTDVNSYVGKLEGRLSDSFYCYALTTSNLVESTTVELELNLFCNTVTTNLVYLYVALAILLCPCLAWGYCRLRKMKENNQRKVLQQSGISHNHVPLVDV